MSERVCKGCGEPLPPKTWPGRDRVWCSERCRRSQYRGSCVDCGSPTDGSDGPGKASERCASCRHAYERATAKWNEETVVVAIRRWAEENGRQPAASDWSQRTPSWCPSVFAVQWVFGSWSAAIRAAGFEPLSVGRPRKVAA